MTKVDSIILAGELQEMGDGLIAMLAGWVKPALTAILGILVLAAVAKSFSLKAGLIAVIGMAIVLGIYESRDNMADAVKDELKRSSGPAVVRVDVPHGPTELAFAA
jgi:phosphotransferase system  glucose/maltose/N-acetylglucosamine-specific IIC component